MAEAIADDTKILYDFTGEPKELVGSPSPLPFFFLSNITRLHYGNRQRDMKELLLPYPADEMQMGESSPRVNSPKNDVHRSGNPFRRATGQLCT